MKMAKSGKVSLVFYIKHGSKSIIAGEMAGKNRRPHG